MSARARTAAGAVLVTGGAGYIGSHVGLACLEAGHEVVVLDDLSTGDRRLSPPGATFVQGAVQDAALVQRLVRRRRIEAIVHLAGSSVVAASHRDPQGYMRNNADNLAAMMRAVCAVRPVPMILASTAAVYAQRTDGRLDEAAATAPASPYGLSKLRAEALLARAARADGFAHLTMRFFNVAGADPRGRAGPVARDAAHLFKAASETALRLRPALPVHGRSHATPDGSSVRDYIHVCDLARLIVCGLEHLLDGGDSQTVNCGLGRGASVLQVVDAFEARLGRRLPTVDAPPRPGEAACVVADDAGLRRLFPAWRPRFPDLADMAATALAWERGMMEQRLVARPASRQRAADAASRTLAMT